MSKSDLAVEEASTLYQLAADTCQVRPGYKLTEVGVIPEDWEVVKFGELVDYIKGYAFQSKEYTRDGIRVIRVSDTTYDSILDLAPVFVDLNKAQQFTKWALRENDLVISTVGSKPPMYDSMVGKVIIIERQHAGALLNQNAVLIRDQKKRTSFQQLLLSHFRSKRYLTFIESIFRGNANQASITLKELFDFPIPCPQLDAEQHAIATALSDVDALLAKLDQLIAKKRDLKQAAMQQLLTGETRLPGFSEEWEVKLLDDLGIFLKGSGVKKDESRSGNLPCIRYGEIYTHHNDYIKAYNSWISPTVALTAILIKQGDLLFAGSGETKEEIGKCVAFVDTIEAYAGGDIVILRPNNVDSIFLGYYCNTVPINMQKTSRGQGDAVVHISANALSSIKVTIPKIEEQAAIATILSDMDAEITALETRRNKTRALKQGMMQELLTGRIRLI